jgi:hypothetical protein
VGDSYGQRQLRNIGADALTGNTATTPDRLKFSEEALVYVDGVAPQQAAAAQDEVLNGSDPWRRLRENG